MELQPNETTSTPDASPPPEAGHPPEPMPQTPRTELPPEPEVRPGPPPPPALPERLAASLAELRGRLALVVRQEMVWELQLADARRTKEQLQGAIMALELLEG